MTLPINPSLTNHADSDGLKDFATPPLLLFTLLKSSQRAPSFTRMMKHTTRRFRTKVNACVRVRYGIM